ncbi:DUF3833 domain-containing protein [Erwinia tracheiphila]|uniref:DUF3833 domain-containing protein n=1 Tax=Erwinia tracheiphila TaxID=65700 RepID=A0A0M2KCP7_9GAMM|nr:DUF3833 domain-containing protein [Erwinia tracheiphila]AXF76285.1 DUF3833 domain-containing protein [Erwinia tracheiphila]EOS96467.1 hypothetical protein ETR_02779 [Erwinia tracheiphila PSU-1]KKF35042.1 lipoprotein [Erwinia tracheiphila]UIA85053.1 DUF3833 domain-containing protein [Erwinia tracheiphila]UIA86701.1 DUF3833 domain-containing protein [Erwinia tracheiphila]
MCRYLLLVASLLIAGCGNDVDTYQHTQPQLDIFRWFNGESRAWGMVQDYRGRQIRRFEVRIHGTVTEDTLTLDERFAYDDGETQTRLWHIHKRADGRYTGTAADIIGTATGKSAGNAFNWRYTMTVKTRSDSYRLNFDDWIFQQDTHHLMNVTSMKKFGVEVAHITLFFSKEPEAWQ